MRKPFGMRIFHLVLIICLPVMTNAQEALLSKVLTDFEYVTFFDYSNGFDGDGKNDIVLGDWNPYEGEAMVPP